MLGFPPRSFPPRKRGPRSHDGAAVMERTSVQRAFRWHDARVVLKRKHPLCRRGPGGSMSFWLPSNAPWSLGPGVRRENEGVGKRGPRIRGGAAATERTSAQRALRRQDARVPAPFVSPAKAGSQEPQWRRCHGSDLIPYTPLLRCCPGGFKKTAPSVPQRPWRLDVLLVATQYSVVPGSRRSPGKRGGRKAGARRHGGAAATEWTSAQRALRRQDARVPAPFVSPAKAGA